MSMHITTSNIRHATEQTSVRKRIMADGREVGALEKYHGADYGWKAWTGRATSLRFLGEFPTEEAAISACLVKFIPLPSQRNI